MEAFRPVDLALGKVVVKGMKKYVPGDEESRTGWRRMVEGWLGESQVDADDEETKEEGNVSDETIQELKSLFGMVDAWYDPEESQPFIMGSQASFADLVVVSRVWWVRQVFGRESRLFKEMMCWNNSRWGKLLLSVETVYNVRDFE